MPGTVPQPMHQRILSKVVKDPSGCWLWTGPLIDGYGRIHSRSRTLGTRSAKLAHRASYEAFVGEIPIGLDLDHMCHNEDLSCTGGPTCKHRACVNPWHLLPATRKENLNRGRNHLRSRDVCANGHPYVEGSYYWAKGPDDTRYRRCKTCAAAATQAYLERKANR